VDAAPEQAVVHSGAGGKAADRRGPATLRPWAEPPPGPQETSVLNHVTLVGNLTADPELRATAPRASTSGREPGMTYLEMLRTLTADPDILAAGKAVERDLRAKSNKAAPEVAEDEHARC
jgi:hypothetical protein